MRRHHVGAPYVKREALALTNWSTSRSQLHSAPPKMLICQQTHETTAHCDERTIAGLRTNSQVVKDVKRLLQLLVQRLVERNVMFRSHSHSSSHSSSHSPQPARHHHHNHHRRQASPVCRQCDLAFTGEKMTSNQFSTMHVHRVFAVASRLRHRVRTSASRPDLPHASVPHSSTCIQPWNG